MMETHSRNETNSNDWAASLPLGRQSRQIPHCPFPQSPSPPRSKRPPGPCPPNSDYSSNDKLLRCCQQKYFPYHRHRCSAPLLPSVHSAQENRPLKTLASRNPSQNRSPPPVADSQTRYPHLCPAAGIPHSYRQRPAQKNGNAQTGPPPHHIRRRLFP